MGNNLFVMQRGVNTDITSKIIDAVTPFGLAMGISATDDTKAVAAYGAIDFEGFTLQEVTTLGPTDRQTLLGLKDLPAKVGSAVSLAREDGLIQVEGPPLTPMATVSALLITSGVGAITAATADQTELGFRAGKWRVAQTGDRVHGIMINAAVTPKVTGNIRCYIRVTRGALKP
jgi:hypothetical protein